MPVKTCVQVPPFIQAGVASAQSARGDHGWLLGESRLDHIVLFHVCLVNSHILQVVGLAKLNKIKKGIMYQDVQVRMYMTVCLRQYIYIYIYIYASFYLR